MTHLASTGAFRVARSAEREPVASSAATASSTRVATRSRAAQHGPSVAPRSMTTKSSVRGRFRWGASRFILRTAMQRVPSSGDPVGAAASSSTEPQEESSASSLLAVGMQRLPIFSEIRALPCKSALRLCGAADRRRRQPSIAKRCLPENSPLLEVHGCRYWARSFTSELQARSE